VTLVVGDDLNNATSLYSAEYGSETRILDVKKKPRTQHKNN
jgi:hypothetical protein